MVMLSLASTNGNHWPMFLFWESYSGRSSQLSKYYAVHFHTIMHMMWNHCKAKCSQTYSLVKVHVVGDDVDIGMEDVVLSDHLLQNVSNTSGEDQQRDLLLRQMIKKHLVAVPKETTQSDTIRHGVIEELYFLCRTMVLVIIKFEHDVYLSIALDSLTAWASMSFLILCWISSSWTWVHL